MKKVIYVTLSAAALIWTVASCILGYAAVSLLLDSGYFWSILAVLCLSYAPVECILLIFKLKRAETKREILFESVLVLMVAPVSGILLLVLPERILLGKKASAEP